MRSVLLLGAVAVMLVAGAASAGPINLSGTTLTFGSGQDGSAALGTLSQIDPATPNTTYANMVDVIPAGTWDVGNTPLSAFRALTGNGHVINFNTNTNGLGGNFNGTTVTSVVAQLNATQSVTFTNFQNSGTGSLYLGWSGGRGRQGAYSGVDSNQCVSANGSLNNYDGGNVGTSYIDFDIITTPGLLVSSIGLAVSFAGRDGGDPRDDGNGNFKVALTDLSKVATYLPSAIDGPTNPCPGIWFGYTVTDLALGITHVHYEHNGGGGQPPASFDDLSFVVQGETATPEPATMSMLILGGIGMIGGVIRRRRTA